ncbi:NS1 protein [Psittacara leucophthalmus chapparvovirus]|uniref:NS1 protein n=1 Tax=Psittacara leucophthalmus chapparvovirus TaxID=2604335 RepID=A0A5C0PXG6_9VIRU|nr:NS1 protein [Psittacara leucophthalmus chapparvovirus]QEJ80805.1 NS1 protein [Psittacara leucophthalmus chapparvovirus]
MASTGTDYGVCLWVGSTGTSRDLNPEQTQALLINKDAWTPSEAPIMHRNLALLDMKQHQCCIIQINDANGEPLTAPLIYALVLNELTTINAWVCTGEYNSQQIFHVHAMVQTSARSDSLRRSFNTAMINLTCSDNFRSQFGQQITIECLKLERCHKPSSMLAYIMKHPTWLCANADRYLQLCFDADFYNLPDRFRPKAEEITAPEMNPMTQEIIDAIISGGCKTFEEVIRTNPGLVAKYLHRSNIQTVIANCLLFVRATGETWSLNTFSKFDINPEGIHQVLLFQGIQPSIFDPIFHAWITKQDPKRNTICIHGPSNSGKSAFISGLKQCCPWGEIVNSNTFAFEGLVDCCMGVWEEPLCSPELAEKAKQVLEGMVCSIPIKFKRPHKLPRTPIIITTNHPLWRFCTAEEEMFRNRMWIFEFYYTMIDQQFIYRTSEPSCECRYCSASRSRAASLSEPESSSMQGGEQSIPPGEEPIRSSSPIDVGSGSMCGTGEGTSRSDSSSRRCSSSSTSEQRPDSTGPSISSSSSIIRFLGHSSNQPSNPRIGICDTGSTSTKHVESTIHPRRDGNDSDGTRKSGGKHKFKRDRGGNGADIRKHARIPVLVGMGETETQTQTIPVQTKKRRLDRPMDALKTNIPMFIPDKQNWQEYLNYLAHWYG